MRAVDELRTGAEICGGHSRFGREARRNFVKKCEKDAGDAATRACDAQAAEKKLSGAAKTGFTKKCVSDAMPAAPAK